MTRWIISCRSQQQNLASTLSKPSFTQTSLWLTSQNTIANEGHTTASKIPPLKDIDQFLYASYTPPLVDIKNEPNSSFYPTVCRGALPRHPQAYNIIEPGLDGLNQTPLDAEFGLSFYDPYVSEPSLDLSPYLEDIDFDSNQESDIFELVSTSPPKDLKRQQQQQDVVEAFLPENDFGYLMQERAMAILECDDVKLMANQTVPTAAFDLNSSGSSAPPSPELPSDTRKLKSKRSRGRRSTSIKAKSLDKNTCEYRVKRERNNVAVRKSRLKTKERHVKIFRQVNELTEENEDLHSAVATLTEELQRLRSYLSKSDIDLSKLELPMKS